jgi:hypothetical protein
VSSKEIRACTNDGQWQVPNICNYLCIGSSCSTCLPLSTQCASVTQVQSCGSDGKWGAPSNCASSCAGGACVVAGPKNVFITSAAYNGNLGGLTGADVKCQMHANNAGLGGTYRAWLSDGNGSPSFRFSKAGGPYVLAKRNITVAATWTEFASTTHQHAIDSDENGSTSLPLGTGPCVGSTGGHQFWSNTLPDGTLWQYTGSCSFWADSTPTAPESAWGRTDVASGPWNIGCHAGGGSPGTCPSTSPLLCVQQ